MAWLIIINLAVFLGVWVVILIGHTCGLQGNFTMSWLCVPSQPALLPSRCWTLLTYMVTQYDFIHLLFNVLWLFWFGNILPEWVSERRRIILYAGGGLCGALTYVACNLLFPSLAPPGAALCGASAAVLSMMAAAGILGGDRKVYLILVGPVAAKWVCLGCIILAFFGFGGGSTAAQSAHIGGVAFGLIYALLLKHSPRRAPRRANLDQLLDKIRLSGYSSLTIGERKELNAISRRLGKIMKQNR